MRTGCSVGLDAVHYSRSPNDLLDLRVGQLACTFKWDLIDVYGTVLGQLHPELGASVSNDTKSTVFRQVRNVRLRESEARDVNPLVHMVRPWMILEDGTQWPLGKFMFQLDQRPEGTLETPLETTLVDQRLLLDQAMPHAYGITDGGRVFDAMKEVAGIYGFSTESIVPTDAVIGGGPVNWPPDATGLQILESLAQRVGYNAPYFDNLGDMLTLRPIEPLRIGYNHTYDRAGGRIEVRTLVTATNLATAPNAYKVVSSGPTNGEIYAVAYVDPWLPHSVMRRGKTIMKVIRRQGLADEGACLNVATALARNDASQYATASFTSVPDPRHDTFDTVEIDGEVYREVSWEMELMPGGAHSHTLVKGVIDDGE